MYIYIHIYGRISDSLYHGNACVQKTFISGWTASFILQILPIPTQRLRPCPKPRIKTDIHGNTRALQPDLWPRPQCQRWAIQVRSCQCETNQASPFPNKFMSSQAGAKELHSIKRLYTHYEFFQYQIGRHMQCT